MLGLIEEDRKSTRLNSSHTVIYTLSLHDALPIWSPMFERLDALRGRGERHGRRGIGEHVEIDVGVDRGRSEEHTSELQSHSDLHSFPTRRSSDLESNVRAFGCPAWSRRAPWTARNRRARRN